MPGLRRAVDRFCKNCRLHPVDDSSSWREQVEACAVRDCPLWVVRPKVDVGSPWRRGIFPPW